MGAERRKAAPGLAQQGCGWEPGRDGEGTPSALAMTQEPAARGRHLGLPRGKMTPGDTRFAFSAP